MKPRAAGEVELSYQQAANVRSIDAYKNSTVMRIGHAQGQTQRSSPLALLAMWSIR
jgi:hypothetical protein